MARFSFQAIATRKAKTSAQVAEEEEGSWRRVRGSEHVPIMLRMNRIGKNGKPVISEKVFQETVRHAAIVAGWKFYHTHNSFRSTKGYPDCCMVKGKRLIFCELKRSGGRFTAEQNEWLSALEAVPGIEVYRLFPTDFDWFWEVLKKP